MAHVRGCRAGVKRKVTHPGQRQSQQAHALTANSGSSCAALRRTHTHTRLAFALQESSSRKLGVCIATALPKCVAITIPCRGLQHTHHAALLLGWGCHLVLAGVILSVLLWALELQAGSTDGQDVVTSGRLAVENNSQNKNNNSKDKSQGCSTSGVQGVCGCTTRASVPHAAALINREDSIHTHLGAAVLNAGPLGCCLCGVKLPVGRAGEGLTWCLDR